MSTEITTYAPVMIPTLNRFIHFKRCLESLSRCVGAENTEVYIAIDFPPSEKYEEGFRNLSTYLQSCGSLNFKALHVLKRTENYGAIRNWIETQKQLFEKYDRIICSEDDNEFSPNFLEYMNKGLEKYKDVPEVYSISGYNYPIDMSSYEKNVYASYHMSAWGVGLWRNKSFNYSKKEIIQTWLRPDNFIRWSIHNPASLICMPYMFMQKEVYEDACNEMFCYLNNMVSIFPTISKVRNHGYDGSGLHGKAEDSEALLFEQQPIDNSQSFEFDEIEIRDSELKSLHNYFKQPLSFYTKRIIKHLCFHKK